MIERVGRSTMNADGTVFCLNARGGTDKAHIINTILDYVRSQRKIAPSTAMQVLRLFVDYDLGQQCPRQDSLLAIIIINV